MNMLRPVSAGGPFRDDVAPCDHPVPLSVLELDMGGTPPEGWANFLGRRAIKIIGDDLGRDSVSRHDAKLLLDEQRENELQKAARARVAEAEAIEADQLRRAQIWGGVSADLLPVGARPAEAMLAAAREAQPRRVTPLQEALAGELMTYHSMQSAEGE